MIDPDTIEDADECDGESLHAYGYDREKGEWRWQWVPIEAPAGGRPRRSGAVGAGVGGWAL
ncbi:hypothetical protein ABIA00_006106 [Bradyrhizobium ottawaense]